MTWLALWLLALALSLATLEGRRSSLNCRGAGCICMWQHSESACRLRAMMVGVGGTAQRECRSPPAPVPVCQCASVPVRPRPWPWLPGCTPHMFPMRVSSVVSAVRIHKLVSFPGPVSLRVSP